MIPKEGKMQNKKPTILAVDDTRDNLGVIKDILFNDYSILFANDGKKALTIVKSNRPDLILLDIMMPEMDGYEVCKKLKFNPETSDIPIIFLTSKSQIFDVNKVFSLGAADYILKPVNPAILKARVKTHLAISNQKHLIEEQVKERTMSLSKANESLEKSKNEILSTQWEIIQKLGRAAEYRDNETGFHVIRMSYYAQHIAFAHGLPENEAELILHVAPMHDIGKIGIPDQILLKPGFLNEMEWNLMKKHTIFGADIIGKHTSTLLKNARIVALTHHEKWDGTGYPNGLSEEDIPLISRIIAIADVFDALTSARPYKNEWPVDKAFEHMSEEKGKHFDPKLIDSLFSIKDKILEIKNKYIDEEQIIF